MNCYEPIVSVITPSYNSCRFIKHTIESVINQTYKNWEMIIVDDRSSDESVSVIENFISQDSRIKLIRNKENIGAAKTRNKAIELAQGLYIAFLDSDDIWEPKKIELQLAFMKKHSCCLSYTKYNWIDEEGEIIRDAFELPLKVNYLDTIKHNKLGCLTVMFKVKCFEDYMMPDIRKRQDFGLWLKLLRQCEYALCLPQSLASYRIRQDSISRNKFKLVSHHWNLYRNIEKHSALRSGYFILYLIFSKILEKIKII